MMVGLKIEGIFKGRGALNQRDDFVVLHFTFSPLKRKNLHDRYTRKRKDLHINQSRNNYADKSIKVTGVKLYNRLPQDIKDSKTLGIFKKRVKKLLIR